jgi:hypothetical protein
MRKIKVFIASPGEVSEERDIVTYVVSELGRMLGSTFDIELEALRWETHAWPDVGDDAQDVINREIQDYDIFVGVMWKRFGSPTKRAESGTGEEFQRAYEFFKKYHKPKIMFYFCKRPFYSTRLDELTQFRKVVDFRGALEKLGVLYWEYESPLEFERRLREHLVRQIWDVSTSAKKAMSEAVSVRPPPSTPTPTNPMKCVFLSYVHPDKIRVREIAADLKLAGFDVWLDEDELLPGQFLHQKIDEAIKRADAMLVFVSKHTKEKGGYFYQELKTMYQRVRSEGNQSSRIIPVRLDPVTPPGDLKKCLWVDVFTKDALPLLVKAIHKE